MTAPAAGRAVWPGAATLGGRAPMVSGVETMAPAASVDWTMTSPETFAPGTAIVHAPAASAVVSATGAPPARMATAALGAAVPDNVHVSASGSKTGAGSSPATAGAVASPPPAIRASPTVMVSGADSATMVPTLSSV